MKKAAALSITAFYLLLTTGMFVCMVHCTANSMVKQPAMQMTGVVKSNCNSDKDCDCCKKHSAFIVKENLKAITDFQFAQTVAMIATIRVADFKVNSYFVENTSRADSNAPPGRSGKSISILFRSLLI